MKVASHVDAFLKQSRADTMARESEIRDELGRVREALISIETRLGRAFQLRRKDVEQLIDRVKSTRGKDSEDTVESVAEIVARILEFIQYVKSALPTIRDFARKLKKQEKLRIAKAWAELVYGIVHVVADAVEHPYSVHSYVLGAAGVSFGWSEIKKKK